MSAENNENCTKLVYILPLIAMLLVIVPATTFCLREPFSRSYGARFLKNDRGDKENKKQKNRSRERKKGNPGQKTVLLFIFVNAGVFVV